MPSLEELLAGLTRQKELIEENFPEIFEGLGRAYDGNSGDANSAGMQRWLRELTEARKEISRLRDLKDRIELEVSQMERAAHTQGGE